MELQFALMVLYQKFKQWGALAEEVVGCCFSPVYCGLKCWFVANARSESCIYIYLHFFRNFYKYLEVFLQELLLPNLVWHAGRTAAAVRTSALSCLLAMLQGGTLSKEQVTQTDTLVLCSLWVGTGGTVTFLCSKENFVQQKILVPLAFSYQLL